MAEPNQQPATLRELKRQARELPLTADVFHRAVCSPLHGLPHNTPLTVQQVAQTLAAVQQHVHAMSEKLQRLDTTAPAPNVATYSQAYVKLLERNYEGLRKLWTQDKSPPAVQEQATLLQQLRAGLQEALAALSLIQEPATLQVTLLALNNVWVRCGGSGSLVTATSGGKPCAAAAPASRSAQGAAGPLGAS
jgi:hypothetical protein